MRQRVFKLIRCRGLPQDGSKTLFFKTAGGDRRRLPKFFAPENVPDFEGEEAWFECERPAGGRWRAIRRICEQERHGRR
ncbi:MAG TPA: hypothetical protein VKT30_06855 [Caulobacteraceae bacterium]|nr:hypothetical protein [Caulobacteraceae bacterium]